MKKSKGFQWKPFSDKQIKLLTWWMPNVSPYADKDGVIAEGSIRAGKTIGMIDSFIMWSLDTFQGENFILGGKTIGSLKRNVLNPMFQILTSKGIPYKYVRSDDPHLEIGDNIYYIFGGDNERSQDRVQGLTAAGAFLDEVALMPKSFVDQVMGRCSVDGAKYFFNCNPAGPYHWFKLEMIDKAKEKQFLILHFTMDDNLSLSQKVKDRLHRMFSGVFFRRYIMGEWVLAEGLIYDMFTKEQHVVPTIEREYTQYYVACDYGTQNPMTFGLWGLYEDVWYKVKEYHYDGRKKARQKTDGEYLEDLQEFIGDIPIRGVIIDPSAASFIALLRKSRIKVIKAKNDVLDGIRRVAQLLNEGKIKYNDCCTETFREFSSYAWDEKAAQRGEDKPKKENDHQMDGDRYFANTIILATNRAGTSKSIL